MKNKMKKLMALGLVASMAVSMCACGDSGSASEDVTDENATSLSTGEKTNQLSIILRGGTYAEVIKAALPEFEEEHNCDIEVLEMSFDDLHTGIAMDATNEQGTYDLCMVDGSWMAEFTQNNVLANLSEMGYEFDDDIIENTTSICMVDGDIYLAPYFGNVTVMMYNKANVEAAGYDADSITTLQDLLEVAQAAQSNGVNGFVYRGDTSDDIVSDFLPILLACGGWVVDDDNNPTVTTDEFKEAMHYYLELTSTGCAMAKDDLTASLDSGASTIAIGWPGWYVPSEDSAASYTVSPTSKDETGTVYNTSEYGTWTIGIPENSQNKELALELLEYLMSPEVQYDSIANGGVPCRYSCLQDEAILEEYPHLATVCAALESGVYRPVISEWSEFTEILGTEMGNIIAGTKDVDEGLEDAQTQLEALMNQ